MRSNELRVSRERQSGVMSLSPDTLFARAWYTSAPTNSKIANPITAGCFITIPAMKKISPPPKRYRALCLSRSTATYGTPYPVKVGPLAAA
jgi:hypothetical protein